MAKKTKQTKKIIICCDGTGNEPSANGSSNVFDLVGLLEATPNQLIYYDPGLGTEAAPGVQSWVGKSTSKLLGMAFGKGLSKNIIDAYQFLMQNYVPGDEIYMFGFSRGAYTVRTIAGMLQLIGLLRPGSENLLDFALANYTKKGKKKWDDLGAFKASLCQKISDRSPYYQVPIRYMGVWDTVKSVGVFRNSTRLAYTDALPNVKSLRHAISLNEKRSKFRPDHATAKGGIDGAAQSMWFEGVHSDIGGGYVDEERGLSDHAMKWIMDGATAQGLTLNQVKFETTVERRQAKAMEIAAETTTPWEDIYYKAHNSLKPIWWVAGWLKRELPDRIWIHGSAIGHFSKSDVNSDIDPSALIKALGDKDAHLHADIALIKLAGNLLIQKLTTEELAELGAMPDDPNEAIKQVLFASTKAWSTQLEKELLNKSFEISKTSEKRARELLVNAAQLIESDTIKGTGGAFDAVGDFLRMTSLKGNAEEKAARLRIIHTAPFLLEALAEF